jgi:hypothetical protein
MRGYELMKETLLRRRFIPIVHLVFLSLYAGIFLLPLNQPQWHGIMVFGSGFLVPIILSAGIFGDDASSGRIALLVTKPMSATILYLWRAAGLMAQGLLHLLAAFGLVVVLHRVTGRCDLDYAFTIWLVSSLLSCTLTTLSATVSVLVKREFNAVIMIVGAVVLFTALRVVMQQYPEFWATKAFHVSLKYGFPPFELLLKNYQPLNWRWLLLIAHALGLTVVYAGIGMLLLARRQFPQARD